MPFRIGPTELIIILVVVMIIFGVGRLPEVGGALGKAIREFRSSQSEKLDSTTTQADAEEEDKDKEKSVA